MKRVLLHENRDLSIEISSDLKQYLPALNQVQSTYENLQLGGFSDEILKEIVSYGTKSIEQRFNESLNSQVEKVGIYNQVLKENLLKGSGDLFFEFSEKVRELKRFKPETFSRKNYLKLNVISFQNGTFYLSDENKEQILENECRIYLENEKEMELFDNLKNFIEAYDKVNENLKNLEVRFSFEKGKGITAIVNTFLKSDENNEYSIVPSSLSFAANYKENKLKFS